MQQKEYKYTKEVLKFVRFKYDHIDIEKELNEHIEDMIEFAPEMTEEETEEYIKENMGDAEEVGRELDKEHKPLLGWIWRISRFLAILIFIINIPNFINLAIVSISSVYDVVVQYDRFNPNEKVVGTIDTNIKGEIDDLNITIDGLKKYEDGTIAVKYKVTNDLFGKASSWTFSFGNSFYDENGNQYFGGGGSNGGFISYCYDEIEGMDENAQKLIIDYDYLGRKFYAEIPLEWEAVE